MKTAKAKWVAYDRHWRGHTTTIVRLASEDMPRNFSHPRAATRGEIAKETERRRLEAEDKELELQFTSRPDYQDAARAFAATSGGV